MILGDFKSCMATRYGAGVVRHCEHGVFRLLCCGLRPRTSVEGMSSDCLEPSSKKMMMCGAGATGTGMAGTPALPEPAWGEEAKRP